MFYSGHYKTHGILTHLLIDYDSWIISVDTTIPGSVHDANYSNLYHPFSHVLGTDLALADPGFQGVDHCVAGYKHSLLPANEEAQEFDKISRNEQRKVEHVNCFIKKNILSKTSKFRWSHEKLVLCIMISCGLYNYKKKTQLYILHRQPFRCIIGISNVGQ